MIVERIYNHKLQDYLNHKKEENVIYVTDLVKCPLKKKYENEFRELALADFFIPSGIMGDLVHSGLQQFLQKEFNADVEVNGEKEVSVNGKTVKIKGRADAIIHQKDGERVVVEIKSARADKGLPLDHHVMQLQIYLWMFEAGKGILVYVTPDRVTEYEVDEPLGDTEVLELVEETVKVSKAPRYFWECSYCQFNVICPNKKVQNA